MKKIRLSAIALALIISLSAFSSCAAETVETTTTETAAKIDETDKTTETESGALKETESDSLKVTESASPEATERDPESISDTETAYETAVTEAENESGSLETDETTSAFVETEGVTEKPTVELTGEHADVIALADSLKNNVTAYFPTGERDSMIYENMEMSLEYALSVTLPQQVTSLKNKSGASYIENTMDVFIEMSGGGRYYAKNSYTAGVPNIYRLGYYYYEMRVEGQTFVGEIN